MGSVVIRQLQAVQAWVAEVNGRGGLNGHLVRLIVGDDGADPARSRALVREMVERHHVIAFVNMTQALSGPGSVPYITERRIPVIGGETGSPWFYDTSPMFFPQAPHSLGTIGATLFAMAQEVLPEGKTKLGTLVCIENSGCGDIPDRFIAKESPGLGFEQVYRGRGGLAQPDYTAECLNARNAGAQVIIVVLDTNSLRRVAASCARQGYHPVFGFMATTVDDGLSNDPNLAGAVTGLVTFPYFQSGTPASDEYQRVIRIFGVSRDASSSVGWVSAKLFDKAAANLPEPPTSEAILNQLWALRSDDLGGLTQPLTFIENRPTSLVFCWWNARVKDRSWVSTDGFQRRCR